MKYKNILKNRYRAIFKYTGTIILILSFVLLLPLLSLFHNPSEINFVDEFLLAFFLALITGTILYFILGKSSEAITLRLKEGGIIVVFSWILAIIISSLPFYLGMNMSLTNSIFESVSGWTTTGLTVVNEAETPSIFLLWRSIMQFFGGAGLAVIALSSILPMQGMGLYLAEGREDKLLPNVKNSTKIIMRIYFGYTFMGAILYKIAGMNLFDSANHSMAALSTGGFSTKPGSIGHWDNLAIYLITILLMFLGTINFATHFVLLRGKIKKFIKNAEIKLMFFLLIIFTPLVAFLSRTNIDFSFMDIIKNEVFQLVSALSTTGYSTVGMGKISLILFFVIILFMLIGGGTGATAGGIKQYRVFIILKSIYWEIKEQFQGNYQVKENCIYKGEERLYIKDEDIKKIANYIILYLSTYFLGVLIFISKGYSIKNSMFEFGSALGTVGLSVGLTGANAPSVILWTEIFGMILGRLEFFIIIFAIIKIIKDQKYMLLN
ncbi:MAG: TrkH family potassium uptake protein [Candidatus Mcinerneyibacterium aminivorans]|uniref:TrkH family potassium uptake protein n=1 Tax=Candidatus Mcinerneyibacterium aminivorans TaxID=2703815 RepID=A0A5D0MJ21_9BACT|nr:MAG: TrkH family potassium uptake protein [Candidatus Mcinerneyibacterium aminivorans]